MGIIEGETKYILNDNKFEYFDKNVEGGRAFADHLILREPDYFNMKNSFKIQRFVTQIFQDMGEMKSDMDNIPEVSPDLKEKKALHENVEEIEKSAGHFVEALMAGIYLSKSIDIGDFVQAFIDMAINHKAKRNIAMIDGNIALREIHIEQMSNDDILGAAVMWAGFFGMPKALLKGA